MAVGRNCFARLITSPSLSMIAVMLVMFLTMLPIV